MGFLGALATVVLSLVGYSTGAALAGRAKPVAPGLLDIFALGVLWAGALLAEAQGSLWLPAPAWLLVGSLAGGLLTLPRLDRQAANLPEDAESRPVGPFKRLWAGWKRLAGRIGNYQGRLLMGLFYFVVVTPFGLAVTLFSDPLRLRPPARSSFWTERVTPDADLAQAAREF